MTIYISGPMSNLPEHNFPAFAEAARALRAKGYTVVSPHECEEVDHSAPKPWDYYVRKDLIAMLQQCDTIATLAGWGYSKGARLEVYVAQQLGFRQLEFSVGPLRWALIEDLENGTNVVDEGAP